MSNLFILLKLGKTGTLLRCILALSFVLTGFSVQANNYYFSSSSGNDSYTSAQAQNQATPWKSIAKLNSFFNSLVAGDNIYFKRGDTFYGCIVVTKSGASGNLITISAYGTGNKPVISGLITLSSWSAISGGIYQAAAPTVKNTVNLVTLNGLPKAVGRYPNADAVNGGYLTYESYSGTSSITDNQLTSATNWTGAEVVIRKQHYALEKCKITSHINTVINYSPTASINPLNGSPSPVAGTNGYGYFIQRDPRTLDQLGEWYFDANTKNIQMYFGSDNPSSYTIKVSTLDTLINMGTGNYINVNNISFEGANATAIYAASAGNLTIQGCDMNLMGGKGIIIFNSPNILIDGINTNNVLCGAIDVTSRYQNNATIRNCTIKNTGMIAGMGSFWDDNDYKAISVTVSSGALIEYNSVENTGYVGIQFQGNNVMVKNNFVNYYDIVKDDGGAIYTYASGTDASPGGTYTNRTVQNNIVLNGIGTLYGVGNSTIDVDGIFLDGRSMGVNILNNTIANVGVNGIYSNSPANVNIRGNTSFNNGSAIGITRYSWSSINNLSIKQNIFYPKYSTQKNFTYVNTGVNVPVVSTIQAAMQGMGQIDSNYHATPNATGFTYYYSLTEGGTWTFPSPLSFEGWKAFTGHDGASKLPPQVASYTLNMVIGSNLVTNGQFTSNISGITTWSPTANITATWDNTSKITGTGSLKIAPLVASNYFTMAYGSVGAVSSSKKYLFRFTTLGTSANGVLKAYIRKSASPQTILTPIQMGNFGTSKEIHEFLFTAPTTEAAASFMIEIQQSSGTTYIDDIAFYEVDATVLNIDDQLRFEYNATNMAKTITLDAKYIGVDSTVYNGSITLLPYTSAILLKDVTGTIILPVPLIDFSAKNNNDKIVLQWQVASEINVSHYEIERSSNGQNFENIGQLNSNNLTNNQSNYEFVDSFPLKGINYYRLVMIDKDGTIKYSKIISVTVKNAPSFILNYLALSAINTNIKIGLYSNYQQVMNLVVADVSGRILCTLSVQLQKGFNAINKKIPALNTGVYYVKLFTSDQFITKPVLSGH